MGGVSGFEGAVHLQNRTHDPHSGSQDHHPSTNWVQKSICCNLTFSAPDEWAYASETCRPKETSINYIVSSSCHFNLFHDEDAESKNPQTINLHLPTLLQQAGISPYFMMKMHKQPSNYQLTSSYIVAASWHFTLFHDEDAQTTLKLSTYIFLHCCSKLAFHIIS